MMKEMMYDPFGREEDYDDVKEFGSKTEAVIKDELEKFEEWLREEISKNNFDHDDEYGGYYPDDEKLLAAFMLDKQKNEIEELKVKLEEANKEIQKNKKRAANEFFKEMGILNK